MGNNDLTECGGDVNFVPVSGDAPHLVVIYGRDRGRIIRFSGASLSLGRDDTNDVVLSDSKVSRSHCLVKFDGREVIVSDLGSTNGTLVNGKKIKEAALPEDSYLQLGRTILKLQKYTDFTISGEELTAAEKKDLKIKKKIDQVVAFIKENYHKHLSLTELAEMFALDPSYFSAFFRKHTGDSLFEYINVVRIMKACDLLKDSDDKILEIAMATGFNNLSMFNRTFKKIVGQSPKEYRKLRLAKD